VWIPITAIGLTVAQFLAWNDIRKNQAQLQKELADTRQSLYSVMWDLSVGVILETTPTADVQIGLLLDNNGQRPIKWRGELRRVTVGQQVSTVEAVSAIGGVVQPGLTNKFRVPWIRGVDSSSPLVEGVVEYAILYGYANDSGFRFRRQHRFQLALYPPPKERPDAVWSLKTGDLSEVEVTELSERPE
jgi:hypothetical protein